LKRSKANCCNLLGRINHRGISVMSFSSGKQYSREQTLVTPTWLSQVLPNPKIKILDASWCMPNEKKDIYADYLKVHIPGAVLFDIDAIADKSVNLPHMLPSLAQFEQEVGKLGISNDDTVVVYDSSDKFVASARVWWTFRVFGHEKVSVLEGGLPKWLELSLPTITGAQNPSEVALFKAKLLPELVKDMKQLKANLNAKEYEVVDARPGDRFYGRAPEPRPGLRSGHIPGSKSVPWVTVLDPKNSSFLPNAEILNVFKKQNVDLDKPLVTTCGSGVTASVLSLALYLTGTNSAIYDGSFSEWGQPHADTPVDKEIK